MKTNLIVFLLLFFAIPSIYAQTPGGFSRGVEYTAGTTGVGHQPGTTSIRSVVAQGGQLKMLLHIEEAGTYQVNIYSNNGQLVTQESLSGQTGEIVKDITFNGNPHGIYVVHVVGTNGQITRDVIW